jgi:hypothetical protein
LAKNPDLTLVQAGAIEGILTFNLVLVALSVTTPGKHTIDDSSHVHHCLLQGNWTLGSCKFHCVLQFVQDRPITEECRFALV